MTAIRRLPWPFLLLFVGAAIANLGPFSGIRPSSSLVLVAFLPVLLFDAGFSLDPGAVRREFRWIALFGLAGALLAAAIAFLLLSALGFEPNEALILSAVLAATDPVAVFAVLRPLATRPRLRLTLEGESLVNDGVAVVLTSMALAIVSTETVHPADLTALFLRLTGLGLAVGAVLGAIGRPALGRLPPPAAIVFTIGMAYAGYLGAERVGGSGLLAVIAIALVLASAGAEPVDDLLHRFWRAAGSVMAAAVFLLMGLQAHAGAVIGAGWRVLLLLVVMLGARALMVLLVTRVAPRLWPWPWRAALIWAGLRGALSLALALSVPVQIRGREPVLALVFGFVLVSLAVQGFSLAPVFRRLGVADVPNRPS